MKRYRFAVHEPSFGASTSCIVEVDKRGIVLNIYDDSTYSTNWMWDGWNPGFLESLVGKRIEEVRTEMSSLFDGMNYGYRDPYVIESDYWGTPDPSTRVEPVLI